MKEKKTDQRIRLTRTLLKNALVQLMQENHISKISVRALCETAGINRSTFYLHYTDPYDLLASVEKEVLDNLNQHLNLQSIVDKQPLSSQVMTRVLDYVKENVDLFKALLSENFDYAFQRDLMELAQCCHPSRISHLTKEPIGYVKDFCLSGTISVLQKWLQEGMQESTAQISGIHRTDHVFGLSSVSNDLLQN